MTIELSVGLLADRAIRSGRSFDSASVWIDRKTIREAFVSETPVPIEGLRGVWCVGRTIADSFALANIIATDETA
jgi:hypothetical protein